MSFDNIPNELKQLKQWVLWKYVDIGALKPTKVPYATTGYQASVTNPDDWTTFDNAVHYYNSSSYDGIGFVFTDFDPYAFIDLDATTENSSKQLKIFQEFNSYSEKSPSGKGLHIIVKGSIPQGRKRFDIEIYSSKRYATMTGNIFKNGPIQERHDLLNQLFEQMGAPPKVIHYNGNEKETQSDQEIIETARNAINGSKFIQLYTGEWQTLYKSQSEADFSLIDMLAFYTQNRSQIYRLFLASSLGQRDKAKRSDYINGMINQSFDRLPPKMDFDGYKIQLESQLNLPLAVSDNGSPPAFEAARDGSNPSTATNGSVAQLVEPVPHKRSSAGSNPATPTNSLQPPSGLVGEIAQFIYQAAPRPVPEIAIAGAIGLMAGICGRAYNVSGTGLNQYILCLAMTGAGKEAMASGIDKIINAVQLSVPVASEFIGPSEIASGQALIKYLANKSQSFVSVLGEFGLRLRSMSAERANSAEIALRRMLLDLYNKSGYGQVARPSIYADSEKNTNLIMSPAFSILGESTPERFYDILNEEMISEGLLPRFMLIEYNGPRPTLNENAMSIQPPDWLIQKIATLMANAKTTMSNRKVVEVVSNSEADKMLKDFDKLADSKINSTDKDIIRQLWNRAHIKLLKISALLAVGVHPFNPTITPIEVNWARNIVESDIKSLSDKFNSGIIGRSSDEVKQIKEIKRMIKLFVTEDWERIRPYCKDMSLFNAKIVPYAYLNKRLVGVTAFKNDKLGPTNSLKRSIQVLVDSDYIRIPTKKEMLDRFKTTQTAYVPTNYAALDD